MTDLKIQVIGSPLARIDGPKKVTGTAAYAYEQQVAGAAYAFPVLATIARGRIVAIESDAARALPGVIAIVTHENAPRHVSTTDPRIVVLQSDVVNYYGEPVAVVVAETLETARQAAGLLAISYEQQPHDVELRLDRDDFIRPERVNAGFPTDTSSGDVEAALALATTTIDVSYTTPAYHNNPMEPHATIAHWHDGGVTLYDANQGAQRIRDDIARIFGLPPERVRVISPYVGGGFGGKAFTHPHQVLAVMAAQVAARPVKLALTRQQMFSVVGYRTPTLQHIRMGADAEGHLTAITHHVAEQTAKIAEFAEQTAVATRHMYAAANRKTSHRLARLDVPVPTIMRAPGETPGMFALESAMDEMAIACNLDPVEFRIRNEPETDPTSGRPFSSRGVVTCLREGAERFGWEPRVGRAKPHAHSLWQIGSGVALSTYPARRRASAARITAEASGIYHVALAASDIGTGAWTILTQIAADALEVPVERVRLEIGDSALPTAPIAGGSMGTASWGTAIVTAAQQFRARLQDEFGGAIPAEGLGVTGEAGDNPLAQQYSMHAFGAQFVEVRVHRETGEVRVPRMLGVFAVGRVINARTARSQLIGGMTMGLSMALHEESVRDSNFGDFTNHDFAGYHIATHADVGTIDAFWIAEDDPYVNPMGAKGIGEIGITGAAAAIANAVYDATGIRIRDLPITLDKLLP